jgi:phenylpropionate dioxygenase-like ring-hydroxylating dioxygenase large terminal subunit
MRHAEPTPEDLRELCDMDEGVLDPRIYADEDVYRLELERIFGRAWVMLCPELQIPRPGDFFNTYVGADRVVVVRQRDGSIKALLNQCRHRGNELVRPDSGNESMFVCSYHGWAYDLSGTLRSVPHEEITFPCGIDMSSWGCATMAQVDTYKGLVFGTWDPTAPPLEEYLGDAAWYLDIMLDRFEGGLELLGGVNKWVVKANWKLPAEQFVNDMLHPEQTHISALLAVIPPDADMSEMQLPTTGRQFSSPNGHGMGLYTDGPILDLTIGPRAVQYYTEESYQAAVERVGRARADVQAAHMNIFPHCAVLFGFNQIRLFHPVGPEETEIWTWQFAPAAAPAEVKRLWAVNTQRAFGAGGLFEADDSAVWRGIQRTLRGVMGRRHLFNVQMGDRQNRGPDPDYPGRVTHRPFSEVAARGYYSRWLDMLTCDTWTEIGEAAKARDVEEARQ